MKKRERELIKSCLEYALALHQNYVEHDQWMINQAREVIKVTLEKKKKIKKAILLADNMGVKK